MAHKHSYVITYKNLTTEQEGKDFLLEQNKQFIVPDTELKKQILNEFNLSKNYIRSFDLVLLKKKVKEGDVIDWSRDNITLVELKTTQKYLPNNPRGFFFGATESEFTIAKKLGNKYQFCFVSLHKDSKSYQLLDLKELESIIKNKRRQYQINLIS